MQLSFSFLREALMVPLLRMFMICQGRKRRMRKQYRGFCTVIVLLSLTCLSTVSFFSRSVHAASPTMQVWLQTMDSCKQALDDSGDVLVADTITLSAQRSGTRVQTAGTGTGCPAQG